jgi:ferredoxin-NADP reductase
VRTFQFTADPAKLFAFRPGQFLTFEFPIDGKTLRRSYSIASSPSRPYTIEVTIKRVDGGRISNWMHDNMTPGASLYATGPFGKFVCPSERDIPLLFLSGGSGATPVMSMTRWLADTAPGADVVFLHFARSPSDVLFHSELAALERRMPRLRNLFVCSRVEPSENWRGPTGRVSADLLRELAPDFAGRRVMLCGPIGFMQSAETALRALQFDMSRFEQESFGGPPRPVTITPSTASVASTAEPTVIMPAPMVKVRFAASMIEAKAARADYLLDVALEKGVDIPYSCRAGQCGSCKATLIEGKVEQNCVDGLKADDVANGMILLCQTRPRGDVTLDL